MMLEPFKSIAEANTELKALVNGQDLNLIVAVEET